VRNLQQKVKYFEISSFRDGVDCMIFFLGRNYLDVARKSVETEIKVTFQTANLTLSTLFKEAVAGWVVATASRFIVQK